MVASDFRSGIQVRGEFPIFPYPVDVEPVASRPFPYTFPNRLAFCAASRPLQLEAGSRSITEQPRSSTIWFTETRPRLSYPVV